MTKRIACVLSMCATLCGAQVAMMKIDDIPGDVEVCVTNWGPFIVQATQDKVNTQTFAQAVSPLQARTNAWNQATSWGNHALAGYAGTQALALAVNPIQSRTNFWNQSVEWGNHALAGYAGTQAVAAVAEDLAALSNTVANLPPPPMIAGTNQWIDGDGGLWRVVQANLTNDTLLVFYHSDFSVYGAVTMTNSGPFEGEWWHQENDDWFRIGDPYAENALYVAAYWSEGGPTVPWIPATPFDKTTFPKTFSHSGATGWVARATYPATVTSRVDSVSFDSGKNLHADSFTNLIWRSVFSNGWHFLVAHTNAP